MPTPSKPVNVLVLEGKSHRTKKEISQREASERSLLTGARLKEWGSVKKDPVAHKEFLRIRTLLSKIEKDDDLYQGVINRYCQLRGECIQMEEKREKFYESISKLESRFYDSENNGGLDPVEFMSVLVKLQNAVISCDKQVQAKRKMMLDIEKECVMTIASALRAIPKKPVDEEDGDDPMMTLMQRQMEIRQRMAADSG